MIRRLLCLFGVHDWELVYPINGEWLRYHRCKHCLKFLDGVKR